MPSQTEERGLSALNVGAHVSLGPKPEKAVESAAAMGFRSMQIFVSSPGAWRLPSFDEDRIARCNESRREWGIDPLFIHSVYLINLASADPALVKRSRDSLIFALQAGATLGASGIITHVGSHQGRGYEAMADQIALLIREVLDQTPSHVDLILENSAGMQNMVGSDLAELGDIVSRAGSPPRLKVVIDTAHLCGTGWDFEVDGEAERLVFKLDRVVGLDRLAAVHANDSRVPCGSRKDRHANIGEGHIGLVGFGRLLSQPALGCVPWILETPNLEARVQDMRRLLDLAAANCLAVEEVAL
jgi:deoxyribonuclease IV